MTLAIPIVLILGVATGIVLLTIRSAPRPAAEPTHVSPAPTRSPTSSTPTPSTVPPVQPTEVGTVTAYSPDDGKRAVIDGLTIAVENTGYTASNNGALDCGGGSHGGGIGRCEVVAQAETGTSTVGFVDFSVTTPATSCRTNSMHINESLVLTEPAGNWIRILVRSIGRDTSGADRTAITFEVSRGRGAPAPQSPKVCAPS